MLRNLLRTSIRTMSSPVAFNNTMFVNGRYVPASLEPLPVCCWFLAFFVVLWMFL